MEVTMCPRYLFQIISSVHLHHAAVFRSCLQKGLWVGVPAHFFIL